MYSKPRLSVLICQPKALPAAPSDTTQTPHKEDKEPWGWHVAPSKPNPHPAWQGQVRDPLQACPGHWISHQLTRSLPAHPAGVVSCLSHANQTETFAARKEQRGLLCREGLGVCHGSKILLPTAVHGYGCSAEKHHLGRWLTLHNTQSSLGEGRGSWAQICIN